MCEMHELNGQQLLLMSYNNYCISVSYHNNVATA